MFFKGSAVTTFGDFLLCVHVFFLLTKEYLWAHCHYSPRVFDPTVTLSLSNRPKHVSGKLGPPPVWCLAVFVYLLLEVCTFIGHSNGHTIQGFPTQPLKSLWCISVVWYIVPLFIYFNYQSCN